MGNTPYLCRMKALLFTILSLGASATATAQFNTISNTPFVYKVKLVTDESASDTNITEALKDSTPPATWVADEVQASVPTKGETDGLGNVEVRRQELIRRYLGVSYPLSHIQVTSQYGMRMHPIMHKRIMHKGIDLCAKYEEVYSVMDGEVIAISGNTGMSTSAHLHLGVRNASGERLDPLVLLEFIRKAREAVVRELQELHEGDF